MAKNDPKKPNPPTQPAPTAPKVENYHGAPMTPEVAAVMREADSIIAGGPVRPDFPAPVVTTEPPTTEEKKGPNSEEAHEALVAQLRADLTAAERERDELKRQLGGLKLSLKGMAESIGKPQASPESTLEYVWDRALQVDMLEKQLQPAHDTFGPRANARGVLVSYVEGSGEKGYDVGGKYRLALVAVEDGKVRISDAVDVIGGVVSSEMSWGLVKDHLDKRVAEFVVPEAHRS